MKRIRAVRLASAAVLAVALCVPFTRVLGQDETNITIPVQSSPIIRVQIGSGTLQIRTSDRPEVLVTASTAVRVHHFTAALVGEAMHGGDIPIFSTRVMTRDGVVTLPPEDFAVPAIAAAPHDGIVIAGEDGATITVTVPQQSALVWAVVGHGQLRLQDYRNGAFIARIRTGVLQLRNVGGDGYAEVARGRLLIEGSAFARIRARSAAGNIYFSDCTARQIEASSISGSIAYDNGTFAPGLARFETRGGNIALGIAGGNVQFTARTQGGKVYSDFQRPVSTRGNGGNLQATVGGDGPVVTASSVSGNVYLYDGAFTARAALGREWPAAQRLFTAKNGAARPYRV